MVTAIRTVPLSTIIKPHFRRTAVERRRQDHTWHIFGDPASNEARVGAPTTGHEQRNERQDQRQSNAY